MILALCHFHSSTSPCFHSSTSSLLQCLTTHHIITHSPMPRVSIKQHLIKWYLAILDAELKVFRFNSLANFLDTELSSLLGHLGSADSGSTQSSPVSIDFSALMTSSSSASSHTQSSLSTEFIMKSSDTGSTISFPWDDEEIEIRVALQASFQRRYTIEH